MNIYQNFGIKTDGKTGLPGETIVQSYIIKSAVIKPNVFYGMDALHIDFLINGEGLGETFGYGLIGEDVFKNFMQEMNVESPEGLAGKAALVHIPSDRVISGISSGN
jgi:hypothetical protein